MGVTLGGGDKGFALTPANIEPFLDSLLILLFVLHFEPGRRLPWTTPLAVIRNLPRQHFSVLLVVEGPATSSSLGGEVIVPFTPLPLSTTGPPALFSYNTFYNHTRFEKKLIIHIAYIF